MLKKISFGQDKQYRKRRFFLSQAPTHRSFTFSLRFLHELKDTVLLFKTMWDFPISIPFRFH